MNVLDQTKSLAARLCICRGLLLIVIGWTVCAMAAPVHGREGGYCRDDSRTSTVAACVNTKTDKAQPVFAYSIYQILGNKTRMIQVATVFMIVGILFLMWGKK